jgi:hypothetical protein
MWNALAGRKSESGVGLELEMELGGRERAGVGHGYGEKRASPIFERADGCQLRVIWPTDPGLECNCARNLQRVPLKGRAAAEFMQIL